ncbi:MAG: HAD family hydrolase [Chloroflexi bacterium]|nr:HAD family hydrolase [Chloroflexota bacterium]
MSSPAKTVFLDRDGTLIVDRHHAFRPDEIELLGGVVEGLDLLQQADFKLVVITNQSGVARGYYGEEDVRAMHHSLREILLREGIRIRDFYHCPHYPDGSVPQYSYRCRCRKPEPGLILRAAGDLGIDLAESWVIGDAVSDIGAGFAAGCRTVLLAPGNGGIAPPPFATCSTGNLLEAARIILDHKVGASYGESTRHRASL